MVLQPIICACLQTLTRSKALGSGPYGALSASYTPGNTSIITSFKVSPAGPLQPSSLQGAELTSSAKLCLGLLGEHV